MRGSKTVRHLESEPVMADDSKDQRNRVDHSANGYHALWHGRMVYQNGRVKHFKTENEAWVYLARCDEAGKIIH